MEFQLTRVAPACFLFLQESGNRVVFWDSEDVYERPLLVATNEKFGSVCFGENELNLKGSLIST